MRTSSEPEVRGTPVADRTEHVARVGLGLFLLAAGTSHFTNPEFFSPLVPPVLPLDATVYGSGAVELAVGGALLPPRWQRWSGWAAAGLFVAVWPGNWYAALADVEVVAGQPSWTNWVRLPLQLPLIALSVWLARRASAGTSSAHGHLSPQGRTP